MFVCLFVRVKEMPICLVDIEPTFNFKKKKKDCCVMKRVLSDHDYETVRHIKKGRTPSGH